jgi:hypothetical protein
MDAGLKMRRKHYYPVENAAKLEMLNEGGEDEMSHTCGNYAADAPASLPQRRTITLWLAL